MRIAVASGDGVVVDQHFGHASRFLIWDLTDGAPRLVETRHNAPACGAGWQPGAADPMQTSVDLVTDCRAVVVAQIGDCAITLLSRRGILAFESTDPVETVLRELAEYPDLAGAAEI